MSSFAGICTSNGMLRDIGIGSVDGRLGGAYLHIFEQKCFLRRWRPRNCNAGLATRRSTGHMHLQLNLLLLIKTSDLLKNCVFTCPHQSTPSQSTQSQKSVKTMARDSPSLFVGQDEEIASVGFAPGGIRTCLQLRPVICFLLLPPNPLCPARPPIFLLPPNAPAFSFCRNRPTECQNPNVSADSDRCSSAR